MKLIMNHRKYAQPVHLKAIAKQPTSAVDNFVRKPLDTRCRRIARAPARSGALSQATFFPFAINELKIARSTIPGTRRNAPVTVPKCA
jgi:hypothetical protein